MFSGGYDIRACQKVPNFLSFAAFHGKRLIRLISKGSASCERPHWSSQLIMFRV